MLYAAYIASDLLSTRCFGLQEIEARAENDHMSEAIILRSVAKRQQKQLCVFDLDSEPASCDMYPFSSQDTFRVLIGSTSKRKTPVINDSPAWSAVLGKDALPSQLLNSFRTSVMTSYAIVSKHQGVYYAYEHCSSLSSMTQPSETMCQTLGLSYCFEAASRKRTMTGNFS